MSFKGIYRRVQTTITDLASKSPLLHQVERLPLELKPGSAPGKVIENRYLWIASRDNEQVSVYDLTGTISLGTTLAPCAVHSFEEDRSAWFDAVTFNGKSAVALVYDIGASLRITVLSNDGVTLYVKPN